VPAPVPKEVVLAALGAAAGLGGLLLVFLGVVIARYESYAGGTPPAVLARYRRAARGILGAFSFSLVSAGVSFLWLVRGGGGRLYDLAAGFFAAQLLAVFAAAWAVTFGVLLRR
jgi:hypothetical protein